MKISDLGGWAKRFEGALWADVSPGASVWRRGSVRVVRIGFMIGRDLAEGQLTLRAMSLVYTALLSLIPTLAITVSVAGALGVQNRIREAMLSFLAPMGARGVEFTDTVVGFVENIDIRVLGSAGILVLVYTVASLLQKLDVSLNAIWRTRERPSILVRFRDYVSVIIVGPVLVFAAIGVTGTLLSSSGVEYLFGTAALGSMSRFLAYLAPYVLVLLAFLLVYLVIPGRRVRLGSAVMGALTASVLWNSMGWAFGAFVVNSARYALLYSAFTTLVMFMIWIYLGFLILLIGASVAVYHQFPQWVRRDPPVPLSGAARERLGLAALTLIGARHDQGAVPWTAEALANDLKVDETFCQTLLEALVSAGILRRAAEPTGAVVPGRPFVNIALTEVLDVIRERVPAATTKGSKIPATAEIEAVLVKLEDARRQVLDGLSLASLKHTEV